MHWAAYRKRAKKAKVHLGFDLNRSIPRKIFLTDGKGAERLFVSMILSPGLTARIEEDTPEELYSPSIVEYAFFHYKSMYPLHEWLKKAIG